MAFHGSPGRRDLGEGGVAVRVPHRGGRALHRLVVAVRPAARGPRSSRADAGSGGAPGRRSPAGANGASPSRSPRSGHGAGGVVKIQGPFVWHKHDETDDFFLVVRGRLTIHLRDRDVG